MLRGGGQSRPRLTKQRVLAMHKQCLNWMAFGALTWTTSVGCLLFLVFATVFGFQSANSSLGRVVVDCFVFCFFCACACLSRFWIADDVVLWCGGPPILFSPRILLYASSVSFCCYGAMLALLDVVFANCFASDNDESQQNFTKHFFATTALFVPLTAFCLVLSSEMLVLRLPVIQCPRIHRIKSLLFHTAQHTAIAATSSSLLSLLFATMPFLPHCPTTHLDFFFPSRITTSSPLASVSLLSVVALVGLLGVCVGVNVASCVLVEVPLASMFPVLVPVAQAFASRSSLLKLHVLMLLRERIREPSFRWEIYGDDSGRVWDAYRSELLSVISSFNSRLKQADAESASPTGNTMTRLIDVCWAALDRTHALRHFSVGGVVGVFGAPLSRDTHRSNTLLQDWVFVWMAADVLTSIATNSLREDSFGVVQHTLADVTSALVETLLALKGHVQNVRFVDDATRRVLEAHHCVRRTPWMLAAEFERFINEIARTFHPHLQRVVHARHMTLLQQITQSSEPSR